MSEDHLIGWLCIMRLNLDDSGESDFIVPRCVKRALAIKGWATMRRNGDQRWLQITEAGTTVSDLNAPEWGINSIPALTKDSE